MIWGVAFFYVVGGGLWLMAHGMELEDARTQAAKRYHARAMLLTPAWPAMLLVMAVKCFRMLLEVAGVAPPQVELENEEVGR